MGTKSAVFKGEFATNGAHHNTKSPFMGKIGDFAAAAWQGKRMAGSGAAESSGKRSGRAAR